jgi:DNA-binding response OmpR family regulator
MPTSNTTISSEQRISIGPELKNEKHKPNILFVIDNEELRQFVYQSLNDSFIITLASDGKEGLEKVFEILPDLIFSDVMMPKINGIELCKAIKNNELLNHIPVILLTSHTTEEHYLDGYKSGADDYLLKLFSVTLLKARIQNLIKIRRTLKIAIQQKFIPITNDQHRK